MSWLAYRRLPLSADIQSSEALDKPDYHVEGAPPRKPENGCPGAEPRSPNENGARRRRSLSECRNSLRVLATATPPQQAETSKRSAEQCQRSGFGDTPERSFKGARATGCIRD